MGPAQPKSNWNTQSAAVQCFTELQCNDLWKTASLRLQDKQAETTCVTRNTAQTKPADERTQEIYSRLVDTEGGKVGFMK